MIKMMIVAQKRGKAKQKEKKGFPIQPQQEKGEELRERKLSRKGKKMLTSKHSQ